MNFRIDPVGAGAAARPLRVKPIPSRRERPSDERERRREGSQDDGATYAPAPESVVDAYGPRAQGVRRQAPPSTPYEGETTPPWVAALLKAR
jgi:hypothetical protein